MRYNDEYGERCLTVCQSAIELATSLNEACRLAKGLFPIDALELFKQLNPELLDELDWSTEDRCETSGAHSFLLSQWYFARETVVKLASDFPSIKERSLFMGAPKVAAISDLASWLVDLGDYNLPNQVSYDVHDFARSRTVNKFRCVLFDPPWQYRSYISWLKIAHRFFAGGGVVIFPLLGELTRPSAKQDRHFILEYAAQLGYCVEILENYVLYDVPSFERAMLKRAGIPCFPWKLADLVVLTSSDISPSVDVTLSRRDNVALVKSIVLNDVIVEARLDKQFGKRLLGVPKCGNLMTSPSSRDVGNANSNVFTSTGYRFTSNDPHGLLSLLASEGVEILKSKSARQAYQLMMKAIQDV